MAVIGAVLARPSMRTSSFMQKLHNDLCWTEEGRNYFYKRQTEVRPMKNSVRPWHVRLCLSLFYLSDICLTLLWETKQLSMSFSRLTSFSQTVWAGARFFCSHTLPSGVSSTPASCTTNRDVDTSAEDIKVLFTTHVRAKQKWHLQFPFHFYDQTGFWNTRILIVIRLGAVISDIQVSFQKQFNEIEVKVVCGLFCYDCRK